MNFHGGDIYSLENRTVLDFSSNINPLGVPESFKEVLLAQINDFTRYPDIKYRKLKTVLAKYLGIDNPQRVVPGNGAVEIIFKSMLALGCRKVIILSPTFSEYARGAIQSGAEVLDLPGYDQHFKTLNLDLLMDSVEPGSLVVICNPNNPTGTLAEKDTLSWLAEKLAERGAGLMVDEAFIEFTDGYPENSMVPELERFPNVVVVRAATKFFGMPGIRLGFGVTGSEKLARKIQEQMEPWNINTAAVLAGCTVYRDQDYINRSRHWIRQERDYLFGRLKEVSNLKVFASKANFHLVQIDRDDFDAWKLKERMIEKGILIRTPDGFNYLSPGHLRLAVKDRESNERLVQVLGEVLNSDR